MTAHPDIEPADHSAGPPPPAGRSSLRVDVISGYMLTASRLTAWAGVSAIVYRRLGPEAFGLLALLRGTITLVGYTSLGLGPAMVRMLAEAEGRLVPLAAALQGKPRVPRRAAADSSTEQFVLEYESPDERHVSATAAQEVYAAGSTISFGLFWIAVLAAVAYSQLVTTVHVVPSAFRDGAAMVVLAFGAGVAARIAGEPSSAALQANGRLAIDNCITAAGECLWLAWVACFAGSPSGPGTSDAGASLGGVALGWAASALAVTIARSIARANCLPSLAGVPVEGSRALNLRILRFGSAIVVAQLADFLYAPADYVLINRFLSPADVASYAPVVQIDAGLLMLVGGLATTLFPHAAVAHARGDVAKLRRLYVVGTLVSGAGLLVAATVAVALSGPLFRAWLGAEPPGARAILPLMLVATVIGGSGAIGRSVLMGMGEVRAITVSALIAGVANVAVSATLATFGGLGLRGIVFGTLIVVVARSGLWTPWYVLRTIRRQVTTR